MSSFESFIIDHCLNVKCHVMLSNGNIMTGYLVHIRSGVFKFVTKNLANQARELYIPIEHIASIEDAI